jgi:hypothetical protein
MGQITPDSDFGKRLTELAKDTQYSTYLEVGTWNGEGSTLCLYKGIHQRKNAHLYTVETNQKMYEAACKFYTPKPDNLTLLKGRMGNQIMEVNHIMSHEKYRDVETHFKLHYTQDVVDLLQSPLITDITSVDVVLLDGGEFTGIGDFNAIMKLNPKVIALDDIYVLKNEACHEYLLSNKSWKLVASGFDRNGWSIFTLSS